MITAGFLREPAFLFLIPMGVFLKRKWMHQNPFELFKLETMAGNDGSVAVKGRLNFSHACPVITDISF